MITIITTCPFCGRETAVVVADADYEVWQAGALIQDAFPYLDADERELLISGICPTCWNKTFGDFVAEEDEVIDEECVLFDDDGDFDLEMGFDPYEGCYSYDC